MPIGLILGLGGTKKPFRCFNASAAVIHIAMVLCGHCPRSLRQVEDILFRRWIDICHETVRLL
jgi:putative transposase